MLKTENFQYGKDYEAVQVEQKGQQLLNKQVSISNDTITLLHEIIEVLYNYSDQQIADKQQMLLFTNENIQLIKIEIAKLKECESQINDFNLVAIQCIDLQKLNDKIRTIINDWILKEENQFDKDYLFSKVYDTNQVYSIKKFRRYNFFFILWKIDGL